MKVRWTRPALADLEAIGDFARDRPRAAERLVSRILSSVEALADHLESGRPGR